MESRNGDKEGKKNVGVNKSCKTRTFPKIKENFNFRTLPPLLMQSNPDIAPTLRSAHECLRKEISYYCLHKLPQTVALYWRLCVCVCVNRIN